jgi:uncharacterized membrane protein YeaQ/YmgE (transglycosylase-associated protein family)
MSALTLRGPAWVAVRLHRRALWAGLGLLVLAAGILLYQRLHVTAVSDAFPGTGCSFRVTTRACGGTVRELLNAQRNFDTWQTLLGWVLFLLPGLVGAFVAGPVIGRELESGTYQLAWTQSVSPTRWLTMKLAVPTLWTMTGVAGLLVLYRWAWVTAPQEYRGEAWYHLFRYVGLGPVALAYTLLGIAVGAFAGLLVRRTVPAMAVTVLTVGVVTALFGLRLRPHLWPVVTLNGPAFSPASHNVMPVENGLLTPSGKRLSWEDCAHHGVCTGEPGSGFFSDYHPASHFWPLQLVESGIILALAVIVTFAAFTVLRRRHG